MRASSNPGLAVCVLLLVGCAGPDSDAFLVDESGLASYAVATVPPDERFEAGRSYPSLVIHNVVPGHASVFGYRWYSPGVLDAIDDEGFEKITIELSSDALSRSGPVTLEFPSQAHLAYTRGGAAWPRAACYGIAKTGSVTLGDASQKSVRVSVRATIEPIRETGDRCDAVELDRDFEAKVIALRDLTPWLGLAAEHPYSETYR